MQLGRYTVLGKLATGGMAEVLLARLDGTSGFEKRVVIKRVLPQFAAHDEFGKMFQQEARFASFLVHPHIAQVSDFGVDETGAAYLVMEFVDGASLRAVITAAHGHHERPDVRLVCRVFSQVAEALAAVHQAVDPSTRASLTLVHRDVSPENVLLSRQGAVKLADFGIARAMNEVSTTRPDVVRGKLHYLAPEQVRGEPISQRIDVWALGVSLYETLAVKRPFPTDNEGVTLHAIANGAYAPLEAIRPDLPAELIAVVKRCLQVNPEDRYPDCQDLALELERLASSGTGSVTAKLVGNWVDRLCPQDMKLRAFVPTPAPVAAPALPLVVPIAPAGVVKVEAVEVVAAPRSRAPIVVGVVIVALLGLAGAAFTFRDQLMPRASPTSLRQVVVTSTPSGAVVKHGTLLLGTTPWAGDLPLTDVELSVDAPGFQGQKKTLAAGDLPSVNVTLKRDR